MWIEFLLSSTTGLMKHRCPVMINTIHIVSIEEMNDHDIKIKLVNGETLVLSDYYNRIKNIIKDQEILICP